MDRRLEFQTVLEDILGSRNVYFQPPENIRMQYPAIVYTRETLTPQYANGRNYNVRRRYMVTYIDRAPDNDVVDKLHNLPLSRYSRNYVADNLNHDVFNIYY